MQAVIEISEEQLALLDKVSEAEGIPRDEVVGKAVEKYLAERPVPSANRDWAGLDAAFGIWKDRGEDGLAYQQRMRDEWD